MCALLVYTFHRAGGPPTVTATNILPAAAPPAVSSPNPPPAVSQSTSVPAVSQSNQAGGSPLAAEFQEWKKMAVITLDNSYLNDHARQRYPAWRRAADQGDPIGQFFVGYAYMHGLTVPEDPAAGFDWLIKSAQQKNIDAMVAVATCCGLGIGTTQNVPSMGVGSKKRWMPAARRRWSRMAWHCVCSHLSRPTKRRARDCSPKLPTRGISTASICRPYSVLIRRANTPP